MGTLVFIQYPKLPSIKVEQIDAMIPFICTVLLSQYFEGLNNTKKSFTEPDGLFPRVT